MSFKPCCISGHLHEGTPKGEFKTINGLKTYVTGDESDKSRTIIYVTDIFGVKLNNALLLADEYAANGFYVLMPDILDGDCIPADLVLKIAPRTSLPERSEEQAKKDGEEVMGSLGPWLGKHSYDVVYPMLENFIAKVKEDPATGKIGAVGFCWGGRFSLLLANGTVDAGIGLHPSFVEIPGDFAKITKPIFIAVGDKDEILPPPAQKQVQEIFKSQLKDVDTQFEVYENAVHGFSVRGDINAPFEKEHKEKVTTQTLEWFTKYLAPGKAAL